MHIQISTAIVHYLEAEVMVVMRAVTCASNKISLFDLSDISAAQKAFHFMSIRLALD